MKKRFTVMLGFCLLSLTAFSQAAYITDKLVAGLYKEEKVTDTPLKALNSGTPLEVVTRKGGFVKVRTSDGTIGWVEATYLTDEKPARSILLDTQAKLSILQKQLEQVKGMAANGSAKGESADISAWQEKLAKAEAQISQLEIQLKAAKLNNKKTEEDQQSVEQIKQQLIEEMQAKADAAQQALKKENQDLHKQIQQVAEILNVPVKPAETTQSVETKAVTMDMAETLTNHWFQGFLVLILLTGFLGGYLWMRRKVNQRFGSVMRF